MIPSMATSIMPMKSSMFISILPFKYAPPFMNAVPYRGPEAPPTVETSFIPTAFKIEPISLPSKVPSHIVDRVKTTGKIDAVVAVTDDVIKLCEKKLLLFHIRDDLFKESQLTFALSAIIIIPLSMN